MNGPTSFQLKGSLYTLPAIHLFSTDMTVIEDELLKQITATPKFFSNAPVVIELSTLDKRGLTPDFTILMKKMKEFGLIPVGVKGGNEEQNQAAVAAGLGVFPENKPASTTSSAPKADTPAASNRKTMIIKEQVRSGTQLYAKDADLVVLAAVSPGAEVIADGNIHVYGPLRGRALAGAKGDKEAMIFCSELDAELISIAGQYTVSEDMRVSNDPSGMTRVFIEEDSLQFAVV